MLDLHLEQRWPRREEADGDGSRREILSERLLDGYGKIHLGVDLVSDIKREASGIVWRGRRRRCHQIIRVGWSKDTHYCRRRTR